MITLLATALTAAVATLLVWGAVSDARTARIPNRLVAAGLVLAPLAALAGGGLTALGSALGAAAVAFGIGFAGFAIGAIGGGDAKFLMVGAALVGLPELLPYLVATGIAGGLVAAVVIVRRRAGLEATVMTFDLLKNVATVGSRGHRGRLGDEGRITVPYGVAIAAGALVVLLTPFSEWLVG